MVIQIDAEVNDSLSSCTKMAQRVAKHLGISVTFYFDRVGYYVSPAGAVSAMKNAFKTPQFFPHGEKKAGK